MHNRKLDDPGRLEKKQTVETGGMKGKCFRVCSFQGQNPIPKLVPNIGPQILGLRQGKSQLERIHAAQFGGSGKGATAR